MSKVIGAAAVGAVDFGAVARLLRRADDPLDEPSLTVGLLPRRLLPRGLLPLRFFTERSCRLRRESSTADLVQVGCRARVVS